jgi:hypothetical protein
MEKNTQQKFPEFKIGDLFVYQYGGIGPIIGLITGTKDINKFMRFYIVKWSDREVDRYSFKEMVATIRDGVWKYYPVKQ